MPGYFPNTKMMFVHSRIYGGYANPDIGDPFQLLNPEPFAYESGFAMKWLIQSQIDETQQLPHLNAAGSLEYLSAQPHAPWIDWGPYLWAGMNSDTNPQHQRLYSSPCHNCAIQDLTWKQDWLGPDTCANHQLDDPNAECNLEALDNTHPGQCGRFKVAWMLKHFYCGKNPNDPSRNYTKWFWGSTQGNVASCQTQEDPKPLDNRCNGRFGQGPE